MGRRKESALDIVASLPWPLGFVLGIVAYVGIRYGIGAYLASSPTGMFRQIGPGLSKALGPLAWISMIGCWLAAAASFFRARHRKQLLETQTGVDSLARMSWQDFEKLVGEAFRRQGYAVEETGLGGADGGIDLILRRHGRKELVQCKQWRSRQVKAHVVREMWGLLAHHKADSVKIVCVGDFTRDARAFAEGKAIELIHGERLLELVREAQAASASEPARPPQARSAPAPGTPIKRVKTAPPRLLGPPARNAAVPWFGEPTGRHTRHFGDARVFRNAGERSSQRSDCPRSSISSAKQIANGRIHRPFSYARCRTYGFAGL